MKHNWRFIKTEESKEHYVGCIIYQCNKCNMRYEFFTESPNSGSAVLNADVCGGEKLRPLEDLIKSMKPLTDKRIDAGGWLITAAFQVISKRLDSLEDI